MSCKYCAQGEKLDGFGYCVKYKCFERAGLHIVLRNYVRKAWDIRCTPDEYRNVGTIVINPYSKNHRAFDDLKYEVEKKFGVIPYDVLEVIPEKFRKVTWDHQVKW